MRPPCAAGSSTDAGVGAAPRGAGRRVTALWRGVALLVIVGLAVVPVAPATSGQAAPPFALTYTRTVAPLDVNVGGTVHATIGVQGQTTPTAKGLDVFFVVDRSITMYEKARNRPEPKPFIDYTRDALKAFVNAMDFTRSKAGVMSYAADTQINSNLTADQDELLKSIDLIRMSQVADVRDLKEAFHTATLKLQGDGDPSNRKLVLIVNAGSDTENALVDMPGATQAARNAGITVAFLMWRSDVLDSAYGAFVGAASECTWNRCVNWSGYGPRYAWRVSVSGSQAQTEKLDALVQDLIRHFLTGVSIARVEVRESYDYRAEFIPITPPTEPTAPPYYDALWRFTSIGPGGVNIEYDARLTETGTYPLAMSTRLTVVDTDGVTWGPYNLPNPDVTVRDVVPTDTPTATTAPPTTALPATTLPPPTTQVPPTTRVPPSVTPTPSEGPTRRDIFMPVALRSAAW